ncbi:putative enoyl-CoA hydratase echA12 [Frankia canadensis]|uniref:Putative enoyl-CoA hydratase echA12 n=1 Tax=Frankia canadensis TaxID=1836972 RepID=A0A2I2KZP7_9ACTN|nr:enoyl-CoA hydratase-related protein [Frankia canadensis]SNQ51138.1 putative enoyl-CoA hydratase echA12 [Frankia canadensis]SOU58428.1 putative enoyl-CoA hydratase echA12 [Frankia canadensis]
MADSGTGGGSTTTSANGTAPGAEAALAVEGEATPLRVERVEPSIAVLTLSRPKQLNALTPELVDLIRETLVELGGDASVRAVVLTGAGRAFCAGLDIARQVKRNEGRARSSAERFASQENFASMVRAIRAIPQPVIAAVNGAAAGAGMGLALAADIRIAAESARFHVAAVKIGLSAGECGISYHLPRHIGSSRAAEIMMTGRPVDAAEADRIGLVSRVVPAGELLEAALDTARAIVANSPFGVMLTKRALWSNLDVTFDTALEIENRTQILTSMSNDHAEAMRAFLDKRPAAFTGR